MGAFFSNIESIFNVLFAVWWALELVTLLQLRAIGKMLPLFVEQRERGLRWFKKIGKRGRDARQGFYGKEHQQAQLILSVLSFMVGLAAVPLAVAIIAKDIARLFF